MRSLIIFLVLQVIGALLTPFIFVPQEMRPFISETPGVIDVGFIFVLAVVGAIVLLIIKLFIPLRWISHMVVLSCGFYLGSFWSELWGFLLGFFVLALRFTKDIWLMNISTSICAISFGFLFGAFVSPEFALLLITALAVYDAWGVLYTKHIQKLWLAQHGKKKKMTISKDKIFDGILMAVPTERGFEIMGVGDYALPLVLVISAAKLNILAGIIIAIFSTFGYWQLQKVRGKILPGIPFIGVGCALGLLLVKVIGLI